MSFLEAGQALKMNTIMLDLPVHIQRTLRTIAREQERRKIFNLTRTDVFLLIFKFSGEN